MMIEAAAESDGLKAIVSEGAGIRSMREALDLTGSERWGGEPSRPPSSTGGRPAVFAGRLPPTRPLGPDTEISAGPVFFIYATPDGRRTPLKRTLRGGERARELWTGERGHTGAIDAEPQEYERRVVGFFDDALLGGN